MHKRSVSQRRARAPDRIGSITIRRLLPPCAAYLIRTRYSGQHLPNISVQTDFTPALHLSHPIPTTSALSSKPLPYLVTKPNHANRRPRRDADSRDNATEESPDAICLPYLFCRRYHGRRCYRSTLLDCLHIDSDDLVFVLHIKFPTIKAVFNSLTSKGWFQQLKAPPTVEAAILSPIVRVSVLLFPLILRIGPSAAFDMPIRLLHPVICRSATALTPLLTPRMP